MISKRKRNTVLVYCMASMIMLCAILSNFAEVTTQEKTNSKKVVANNNYVETEEISYGLVALEASSCIEKVEDANVTENKKVETNESAKTTENKNSSSANKQQTKATTNTTKTNSKKTTTKTTVKKATSSQNTKTKVASNVELGTKIVNYAKQFIGNPYKSGGTSLTKGADCSGFVQSVFKHFGINLPRVATSQSKVGSKVSFSELEPGDLVFYNNGGSGIAHVAIYMGNGKIVHSRTPKEGIGVNSVNIMHKVTARRVIK